MKREGVVLFVVGSAVARDRLRRELGNLFHLRVAASFEIGQAFGEDALPSAAVVTVHGLDAAGIALVRWLSARSVPVLALVDHDEQRPTLVVAGARNCLVVPGAKDELAARAFFDKMEAWLAATLDRATASEGVRRASVRPNTFASPTSPFAGGSIRPLSSVHPMASVHPRASTVPSSSVRPMTTRPFSRHPTPEHAPPVRFSSAPPAPVPASPSSRAPALPSRGPSLVPLLGHRAICIGISTGGPEALETLLSNLPAECPPILIVQHMPSGFTAPLADRLNRVSALEVREATDGERLTPGTALLAPGGRHLRIRSQALHIITELSNAPPVDRHRPSVNVLFESAAEALGRAGIGVIMTGMGDDGVRGLLAMRMAGADTLAQDAESSVVFGMPQRAIVTGAARDVVSLSELPSRLMTLSRMPFSALPPRTPPPPDRA